MIPTLRKRHRHPLIVIFTINLATVLIAPSGRSVALADEKGKAPQTATTAQTQEAAKVVATIPEAEKNRKNPIPATPDSIESGRNLYSSQCAMCHGANGNGKGELVARLNLKVPDFTDSGAMKNRTDGELHYILTKGHGDMPPETRLEPKELWDMINCIRSFPKTKK